MTAGRLALALLAGTLTGLGLAMLAFGPATLRALIPAGLPLGALAAFHDRLAAGRPLPTDLLALACLTAIPAFGLWDLAGTLTRRRELARIRREMGLAQG